jgi:hypothetical protein
MLLVGGRQNQTLPPVVGIESSELDAWLDAHKTQSGAQCGGASAELTGCGTKAHVLALVGCLLQKHIIRAGFVSTNAAEEAVQPQPDAADASSLVSAKEERDLQV